MRIPRIYQALPLNIGDIIPLDAQAATHIARVLRLKPNDQIIVFNGQGGEYVGVINEIDKRTVTVKLISHQQTATESSLHITLVQGISRGERMDYTLQKSVELGVSEIYPVTTQHVSVHLDAARAQKKQSHWQGIVNSACEQSGRVSVPEVFAVQALQSCVEKLAAVKNQLMVVLDHRANTTLTKINRGDKNRIIFVVGPEGGLSVEELDWLANAGFTAIAMGPRVLRTETAALAAISVMQALWGDFN